MAKFSKFDETKISLVMTLRGVSRKEAIAALRREGKGLDFGCKGMSDKATVSMAGFIRHNQTEMLSAEEFFGED